MKHLFYQEAEPCQQGANMLLSTEFIGHFSVQGRPAGVQDELERVKLGRVADLQ